jgi:beta-galactosidase
VARSTSKGQLSTELPHGPQRGHRLAQLGAAAELTLTRRAALQAGLVGAAALAYGSGPRLAAAQAAPLALAAGPGGAYAFNQDWLFGGVYVSGAEAPAYSDSGFANVTLPHTVTPLSWGDWEQSSWEQVWIYRKHINQSAVAGGRVFVDFQGVMTTATVYLGGVQIAVHQGGYLPWSVELTSHLAAGDNVLAVIVDARWLDVPPDGNAKGAPSVDYLQPGGIYRDATLRIVPQVFISDVFAKPTNVLSANPGIDVQFTIDAASIPSGPVMLSAAVLDGTQQIGAVSGTASVTATGATVATLSITGLSGVGLWSPDSPKLYQVNATLTAGGVSHSFAVTTGFRQATFQTDGFYLNGQRLEIFGLNRHQLFPYTGMAAAERLQRRDAELLRTELNCNMVRCSHYPQSPYFLDACDELGLMVWEEPPGWQYVGDAAFQAIVLQNVQDMVVRDRNRPSVILWATRLNETANYTSLYAQTRQLAYTLDGTRQTSGAMTNQSTTGWAEDVFAYDDYDSSGGNATLKPPVSGVPYLVSESVGALDGAPLYRWVDTEATLAIQAKMHAQVHNIAQSDPAYAGLLGWAGIDYASLNGGNRIWHNVKWPGVLDTFRVAKPGAAFYRSQVDPTVTPLILPVFFWDFGSASPASGPGAGTMIATNCDRLEIYVGGQHFATGTPDTQDYASLSHPPVIVDLTVNGTGSPELRVDGYLGSQLVGTLQMSSDPTQDRLVLTLEDASIAGDGTDMTRFTFRALDAYGNQRPNVTGDVTLSLTGPATLIAENPFAFATYGGVGGAFIRSEPGTSGSVTVTASHPTLGQASAGLTVTPASEPNFDTGPAAPPAPPTVTPTPAAPTVQPSRPVPPSPPGPSPAKVRSALAALLSPRGAQARIARLLHNSGYAFEFDAPSTGKLVIDWYYSPAAARPAKARKPKQVVVAAASESIKQAGKTKVKLELNVRGRSLLRHAKRQRLTVQASFTPMGESTTTASRVITLRR